MNNDRFSPSRNWLLLRSNMSKVSLTRSFVGEQGFFDLLEEGKLQVLVALS